MKENDYTPNVFARGLGLDSMKTVGIITEYNPFHQGHIYHIQKAKQYGDVLVAICSGFYSQRGLPSLISRQDKTK